MSSFTRDSAMAGHAGSRMSPDALDDMSETFSELAVKQPDLMRLVLQACVAAMVNVQSEQAVDAEIRRRAVVGN